MQTMSPTWLPSTATVLSSTAISCICCISCTSSLVICCARTCKFRSDGWKCEEEGDLPLPPFSFPSLLSLVASQIRLILRRRSSPSCSMPTALWPHSGSPILVQSCLSMPQVIQMDSHVDIVLQRLHSLVLEPKEPPIPSTLRRRIRRILANKHVHDNPLRLLSRPRAFYTV